MGIDTSTVSLIAAGAAFVGVIVTGTITYFINQINRHKSYNEWRREKLYVQILVLREKLKKAAIEAALSTSKMKNMDEKAISHEVYSHFNGVIDDVSEIAFLLNKRERDKLYQHYIRYVESQVEFRLALQNINSSMDLTPIIKRSQSFTDYVSNLIYEMK